MKKVRRRRTQWRKAAAAAGMILTIAEFSVGSSWGVLNAWAVGQTGGQWTFDQQTAGDSADLEITEEDLLENPEDISDAELNQMVDEYLKQLGGGGASVDQMTSETIKNPRLKMESAGKGKIRYTLPNYSSFTATVPSGMITERKVEFEFPNGVMGTVQKDDQRSSLIDEAVFMETGVYRLKLLFYQSPSAEIQDYNVYEVSYCFTIIGETDGSLGVVTAPEQFEISEVIKDGVPQKEVNPEYFFLGEDGIYEIRYQDLETGMIHLETNFVRDTTAPFLTFSKELTGDDVVGPVSFTSSEPGSAVTVTYNGNQGQIGTDTLTAGGFYELKVSDQVGNSRTYYVNIRQTYKLIDTRLVILALILLTGMGLRLLFLRRNMRVI